MEKALKVKLKMQEVQKSLRFKIENIFQLLGQALLVLRALLGLIFIFIWTAMLSIVTMIVALFSLHSAVDFIARLWGHVILWFFNVRLHLSGQENLPAQRGVLFLFNHQSNFDIFCIYGFIPKRVRFGAKIELFRIPIFAQAMRMVGTLAITRSDRAQVFEVYRQASSRFRSNWSYALAPEGTRQDQPIIGEFKKGPFIFALQAQVPIVPVVLRGAFEVMPKTEWLPNIDRWRRDVYMQFLPPIETEGLKLDDLEFLRGAVHTKMVQAYEFLPKPQPRVL